MSANDRLLSVIDTVKTSFVARDEVIDHIHYSLINKSHTLLIGPPGAAKSALFGDLLARLEGKHGFFTLTKGSTPESVLGPMSLRAIKEEDVFRYNTTGMAPDSHYVFIDEVFNGNHLTRSALHNVLNERRLFNGGEVITCPLIFAGAASNQYPDAQEDAAFKDRFLVTMEVGYITDHYQRMKMVEIARKRGRQFAQAQTQQVTLADIEELHQRAQAIEIPEPVAEVAGQIYDAVAALGTDYAIGDRRFAESFSLAAAKAVAKGRDTMTTDDLDVFNHTAWRQPETRQEVQRAVLKAIAPEIADITTYFDAIEEGFQTFKQRYQEAVASKNTGKRLNAHTEFVEISEQNAHKMGELLTQITRKGGETARAVEFISRAKARMAEAAEMTLYGTRGLGGANDGA